MKNHHSPKSYKKCIICGNNFVTTEIDSEVFCKDCQTHRDTAETLQNLLKHINPNEKFSIGDLIPYYKFSTLNDVINALMDDGLLDFNPNDNTYSLKDEKFLNDFLNKYLIDPETVQQPSDEETFPYNYTKKRHEIVIEAINEGKTRKEAAKLAGIKLKDLERWYLEGQKGIEPFKQYYEDYKLYKKDKKKKSEEEIKKETEQFNLNQLKIKKFIDSIMFGFTVKKSAEISELDYKQAQKWLYYGNREKEPFKEFSKEYKEAKKEATKNKNKFKKSEVQREAFIVHIKTGCSMIESCQKTNLEEKEVLEWIEKGKDNLEPYVKFYESYQKVKPQKNKPTTLEKDKERYTKEKHETIINAIKEEKSITEAVKLAGINIREESRWYTYGQQGIDPFIQYYEDYNFWKKEIKKEKSEFIKNYKKINIFIKATMAGKNYIEAAQTAELNERKLQKWLDYGKQGIEPFKITFEEYQEVKNNESTEIKTYSHNYTKKRHEIVINAIKEGKTRKEAAELAGIQLRDIQKWYLEGQKGKEPFKQYYEEYLFFKPDPKKQKEERIKRETEEFVQSYDEREKFLLAIKDGKTVKIAAEMAELDVNQINKWFGNGREGIEPFKQFYEYYMNNKIDRNKKIKEENIEKAKKEFEEKTTPINKFLISIREGKTQKEALNISGLGFKQVQDYIRYGQQGIEPFKQFFIEYKKARGQDLENFYSAVKEKEKEEDKFRRALNKFFYIYNEGGMEEELLLKSGLVKQIKDLEIKEKEKNKEYIRFLRRYRILKNKCKSNLEEYDKNKENRENFISEFKNNKDEAEALYKSGLKKQLFNKWIEKGKKRIKPYSKFFDSYNYLKINREFSLEDYNSTRFQQAIFLEKIADETTVHDALKISGLEKKHVIEWIRLGKEEIDPFKQFLEKYEKAKEKSENKKNRFKRNGKKRNIFIIYIENKDSMSQACKKAKLEIEIVEDWLVKGKNGQKPYDTFYKEYHKARENSIKHDKLDLDLTVLKEEKESLLISIKGKINESAMGIVNNIMKTYNYGLYDSSMTRLKNNKLKISIKLKIKKNELDFIKSLINSY